jgi:hypothetical protein
MAQRIAAQESVLNAILKHKGGVEHWGTFVNVAATNSRGLELLPAAGADQGKVSA